MTVNHFGNQRDNFEAVINPEFDKEMNKQNCHFTTEAQSIRNIPLKENSRYKQKVI